MKNNQITKITEEYRQKREWAQREAIEKAKRLRERFSEYGAVEDEIYRLHLQIAKATLNKEENPNTLQQELERAKQKKKDLMLRLGISDADLSPRYECIICEDRGYIEEEGQWKRCACFQNRLMKEWSKESGMMNRMERENFENFREELFEEMPDPKYKNSPLENIRRIREESVRFIEDFENPNRKNLIFYGTPGTGKTFLCTCIAKELMNGQKTVFYQSASDLFDVLSEFTFSKEEIRREELRKVYQWVHDADLLIIDDLGSELTNSFTVNMLFNILNHRMMNERKMILSTNLSPNELHERYGERIASRLVMGFDYYRFYGKDLRWCL